MYHKIQSEEVAFQEDLKLHAAHDKPELRTAIPWAYRFKRWASKFTDEQLRQVATGESLERLHSFANHVGPAREWLAEAKESSIKVLNRLKGK